MLRCFIVLCSVLSLPVLADDLGEQLLAAVRKGDAAAVKALLAKGADANAKSPYGATGLFFAADRGNAEVARILLDHGADPNVKDTFYGATAMTWALQKKHVEVIKVLLAKGADGEPVLMAGVNQGNAELVKAALAGSGLKSDTLSSALAVATRNNRSEIVELLKKAGAVPFVEFPVDPATLQSYAGSYKGEQFDVKFEVVDGKLTGGPPGQKLVLRPVSRNTFKTDTMPATLVFEGTTLIIKVGSDAITLKKVEAK